MRWSVKHTLPVFSFAFLTACGGGSGSDVTGETRSYLDELQGTWVYSSDDHYTGGACGLDLHGAYGRRLTITITGNSYVSKDEFCLILSGNTGGYLESSSGNGTVKVGQIFLNVPNDPSQNMRAIDFISSTTFYTSYRVNQTMLYVADALNQLDGSTEQRRAYMTPIAFSKQ
ncbi:MAG: hypothetical protein ACOYB2_06405 [Limnohabitans sp.]